jgi:hypothetical protein
MTWFPEISEVNLVWPEAELIRRWIVLWCGCELCTTLDGETYVESAQCGNHMEIKVGW